MQYVQLRTERLGECGSLLENASIQQRRLVVGMTGIDGSRESTPSPCLSESFAVPTNDDACP
jgi:hypothetical protein